VKANGDFEDRLDAVLDGEADAVQLQRLRDLAADDSALAGKLALALEAREALRRMGQVKAPPLLAARLRRIPRSSRRWLSHPWGLGIAAGLLLATFAGLLNRGPSQREVLQIRRDLAVAFTYLEKTSAQVSRETRRQITHSVEQPLGLGLNKARIL